MAEQKKYMSVVRLGHKTTLGVLNVGDRIVVQEKLDGANASVRVIDGKVHAYSRNTELSEDNTLGGFYNFAMEHVMFKYIPEDVILFGEYLNPHKVKYPDYQKQFFLYDVYNVRTGMYEIFSSVKVFANALKLNLIPVLYEGEYQSFEHLQSLVGQTKLGGVLNGEETGEGIVVKNPDYVDRFGNQLFVKLVTDSFREVQKQKAPKDPNKEATQEQVFVSQVVTEPRVEKFLHKFVDEGILDEHYGIEDMGTILKNMNQRIYDDVLEEESDMLPEEYDVKQLRKAISRTVVKHVKILLDKQQKL